MFIACSPTCMVHPNTTSSMTAGSRSLRSTRARRGCAARSTGCHPDRFPLRFPTGVRTASTITASLMGDILSCRAGRPRPEGSAGEEAHQQLADLVRRLELHPVADVRDPLVAP